MAEISGPAVTMDQVEGHLQAVARFRRAGVPEWANRELNFGQLRLLFIIGDTGPVSIGQLAARIGVTAATASELVDRVERRGFVRRFHRTDDRRVVDCELTEDGSRLLAQIATARRQAVRRILSVLTERELGELDRLLLLIGQRLATATVDPLPAEGE
jgi:MarR family transcriptional regulator, organic hydroperoxide resistance regulator